VLQTPKKLIPKVTVSEKLCYNTSWRPRNTGASKSRPKGVLVMALKHLDTRDAYSALFSLLCAEKALLLRTVNWFELMACLELTKEDIKGEKLLHQLTSVYLLFAMIVLEWGKPMFFLSEDGIYGNPEGEAFGKLDFFKELDYLFDDREELKCVLKMLERMGAFYRLENIVLFNGGWLKKLIDAGRGIREVDPELYKMHKFANFLVYRIFFADEELPDSETIRAIAEEVEAGMSNRKILR
jgi:hypothetical protein